MSVLNDLVNQIEDVTLRNRISAEVERLSKQKKFGLVFEEHLPECTPLYDMAIKRGITVARRTREVNDIYIVAKINGDKATCVHRSDKKVKSVSAQWT